MPDARGSARSSRSRARLKFSHAGRRGSACSRLPTSCPFGLWKTASRRPSAIVSLVPPLKVSGLANASCTQRLISKHKLQCWRSLYSALSCERPAAAQGLSFAWKGSHTADSRGSTCCRLPTRCPLGRRMLHAASCGNVIAAAAAGDLFAVLIPLLVEASPTCWQLSSVALKVQPRALLRLAWSAHCRQACWQDLKPCSEALHLRDGHHVLVEAGRALPVESKGASPADSKRPGVFHACCQAPYRHVALRGRGLAPRIPACSECLSHEALALHPVCTLPSSSKTALTLASTLYVRLYGV